MSQIHLKQVEAAVRLAEKRGDDAVALMREAAQIADAPGVSWAPPDAGTGLPTHEFFGEILMDLGRYKEAQQEFQKAVERTPNRLYSVYGLAKSAALAGDRSAAETQFKLLSELLADADPGLPEAAEAKQYLTRYETARLGR
jgi:tetratricopeptide (TPR) repeat protein